METTDSSPSVSPGSDEGVTPIIENEASTSTHETTSDAAAPSSGATEGESKESLLDAVMKVVKPSEDAKVNDPSKEAAPASDQPSSGQADGNTAATEEELAEDPSKEELDRYHSRTRKRIEKLLDQRNQARAEIDSLKAAAEIGNGFRNYLQQNDISKEDLGVLLDLGAALRKGDLHTFYEGITPYVRLAEEALGIRIPSDLQQHVQHGHMTNEAASVMSRERYARLLAEQQAAQLREAQQTQQTQAYVAQVQNAIANSVTQWEATIRQSDPDYGLKQDAVKSLIWAVVQERGAPQSPEHAVEIAKEAYNRANRMVSQWQPKPKPTSPAPSSVHRSTGATAEPKSLMEAALLGLQKTRRSA